MQGVIRNRLANIQDAHLAFEQAAGRMEQQLRR
jgi:hypothetical protein